jgi:formylglycine-generating enzyme required for sulfatase activity
MNFLPVPPTKVLFSIWDTRVKDFEVFVNDTQRDMGNSLHGIGADGYKERTGRNWRNPGFTQTPNDPVVGVTWNDAVAFCQWLTAKDRKEGRLSPDSSYRLPTDDEWSVAVGLHEAPGGSPKDKSGKIKDVYPWGTAWPPPKGAGNYAGSEAKTDTWPTSWGTLKGYTDDYPRTSPVGSFKANQFGLYDVGGNVWNWCQDWFDDTHMSRVLRGASFPGSGTGHLNASFRMDQPPDTRYDHMGFRCVLEMSAALPG